jgi:periplasmic protein TonB
MMISTADGPALVTPFDYNERRTPRFSRTTWIALAVVAAGHVGLGAALYYQRFELAVPPEADAPPTTLIELVKLPKPPEPKPEPQRPQPPNTRVNDLPAPPTTADVVTVVPGETIAVGPTISLGDKVPAPMEGAPPAVSTPEPPAVITNPSWIRQPSAAQLLRAYPDRAVQAGVGGRATLNCLVQPNGRVTDCNLLAETPGGYGFGSAAQGLTRHFQINPRTVDGAAVGSRVNIGIRFSPPA